MSLLVASTIDVTIILAAALSGVWLLRRRSAALRHAVLAAGILMAALAPLLEAALPQWSLPMPVTPAATIQASPIGFATDDGAGALPVAAAGEAAEAFDWAVLLLTAWAAGAATAFAGLITGLIRLRRIVGRCTPVGAGAWRVNADAFTREHALRPVTLLQSGERALLVTWGWRRPRIVLPAECDAWPEARRCIVLAHEIAHIRRRDWATQMLAEALRAVFWFHPLVWVAARRLRQESEYACDDVVMARGVEATEYATHLLDVARHVTGRQALWAAAPAIATPSTLERRIAVMLNAQRNRDPLTRHTAALVLGAALAIAVPVAAMSTAGEDQLPPLRPLADVALAGPAADTARDVSPPPPQAVVPNSGASDLRAAAEAVRVTADALRAAAAAPPQETPAAISGTLYDPLGGLLPGVALTLTDQVVGITFTATTDRNGTFAFADLQPATYELRAVLPGFSSVSTVMPIGAGANLERRIVLPIGSLQETITVVCSSPAQPSAPRPLGAVPPRVLQPRPGSAAPQAATTAPFNGGIGGQIRAPRQIAKANPICPNHVGVSTVVILGARVGIDGYLSDIKDLRNEGRQPEDRQPQEIVDSAIDAVRLWQYSPTLLNGVPVEANITVTVLYTWQ